MEEQAVVLEKESWSKDMKQRFEDELSKIRINAGGKKKKNAFFNLNYLPEINKCFTKSKMTITKQPRDYWLLNCNNVMIVENKSKLICPVKKRHQYYTVLHHRLKVILRNL